MQNSDLKNVLIAAVETADSRLLSMLYAVIKTYQITGTPAAPVQETPIAEPVQTVEAVKTAEPVATFTERAYKDDRPRRVVRIYRKPQSEVESKVVRQAPVTAEPVAAPRVIRVATPVRRVVSTTTPTPAPTRVVRRPEDSVSGRSNNGGFITDLMTKTVSKNGLPA